jgi:hypothetical protein
MRFLDIIDRSDLFKGTTDTFLKARLDTSPDWRPQTGTGFINWAQQSRFYLKRETEFSLWNIMPLKKVRTINNIQESNHFKNTPSSKTFRSNSQSDYGPSVLFHFRKLECMKTQMAKTWITLPSLWIQVSYDTVPKGLLLKASYHSLWPYKILLLASKALLTDRIQYYQSKKVSLGKHIKNLEIYSQGSVNQ